MTKIINGQRVPEFVDKQNTDSKETDHDEVNLYESLTNVALLGKNKIKNINSFVDFVNSENKTIKTYIELISGVVYVYNTISDTDAILWKVSKSPYDDYHWVGCYLCTYTGSVPAVDLVFTVTDTIILDGLTWAWRLKEKDSVNATDWIPGHENHSTLKDNIAPRISIDNVTQTLNSSRTIALAELTSVCKIDFNFYGVSYNDHTPPFTDANKCLDAVITYVLDKNGFSCLNKINFTTDCDISVGYNNQTPVKTVFEDTVYTNKGDEYETVKTGIDNTAKQGVVNSLSSSLMCKNNDNDISVGVDVYNHAKASRVYAPETGRNWWQYQIVERLAPSNVHKIYNAAFSGYTTVNTPEYIFGSRYTVKNVDIS